MVVFISILIILPFIYVTSLKEDTYNNFFWWCRVWAKLVLRGMGYWWKVTFETPIDTNQRYIIIANHASEIDIMMTLLLVRSQFVFIGKAELAKLPLFGYFYKRTNILVDRSSIASKRNVLKKAMTRIDEGDGVCIYPEGGIPDPKFLLAPFKMGAFKVAVAKQLPILPITFINNKNHFPDFLEGGYPGKLTATVHKPIPTTGLTEEDLSDLQHQCYQIIYNELIANGKTGNSIFTERKT